MRECNETKSVLFKEGHSIMDEVIRRERDYGELKLERSISNLSKGIERLLN